MAPIPQNTSPPPHSEARSGLYLLEQSLWNAVPAYMRTVSSALKKHTGVGGKCEWGRVCVWGGMNSHPGARRLRSTCSELVDQLCCLPTLCCKELMLEH